MFEKSFSGFDLCDKFILAKREIASHFRKTERNETIWWHRIHHVKYTYLRIFVILPKISKIPIENWFTFIFHSLIPSTEKNEGKEERKNKNKIFNNVLMKKKHIQKQMVKYEILSVFVHTNKL